MSENPHKEANARLAKKAAAEHAKRKAAAAAKPAAEAKSKQPPTKAEIAEAKSKQPPTKAEIAEAKGKLEHIAKEANARFEIADREKQKSEDHCLAAAIVLKDAEDYCKTVGVSFKEWCLKNIKQSYETARKYLGVAKQPDPVKALEDMRKANARRNKEARARAKAGKTASRSTSTRTTSSKPDPLAGYEAVKAAFGQLGPKDQVNFVRWAAEQTGYRLVDTVAETAASAPAAPLKPAGVAAEDGSDVPAHLARGRKTPPSQPTA